ncbi:MAG: GH92 family glycosyl hydrolase [Bacteroidota bacterium]|nr:GH92 family glycosyl hydrolase [Bacteroidota bacterium]
MNRLIGFCLLLVFSFGCNKQAPTHKYIDPLIGTGGHGHTYPGPSLPFGMVQLSPDTRLSGWDGCSGYHYSDSVIYGFSHTHLSGTGVSDYGDILLMPTVGHVVINPGDPSSSAQGYSSRFSHDTEEVSAGYYKVYLEDYKIDVELTSTQRAGLHKYTFPKTTEANIILDLQHRDEVLSSFIRVVNEYEIEGLRRSKAWAKDQYVYFVVRFSKPFKDYGLYLHDKEQTGVEVNGRSIKAHFSFTTKRNEEILVKVGISAVSTAGARKNLEAEIPQWRFENTKGKAQRAWQNVLDRYRVDVASESQKRIFYTAVYHQYLNPNLYMDVDSLYRGRDLLIHKADNFSNYTLFSLWDTFRATHPLFTIMEEDRTNDFISTFITQYEQGGVLPVWELSANETGTMIGYHAVSVIADAFIKGIRDYDLEKAYKAMKNSAERDVLGLRPYKLLGYVSASEESESVSKTLEYAYDDWCIAQVASGLGRYDDYQNYLKRGLSYMNLYDPQSGFMRARTNSLWFYPFDPKEVNFNYTEANAWQYSFFVPQDISGLIGLMGGDKRFVEKLDSLFTESSETTGRVQADITGLIGQYAHGNEPSHHMAYLYSYAGEAWKTQYYVDQILNEFYSDAPDGLCGNEDCGQMSAWYIFSALGFYPVTPGLPEYTIGAPLFKDVSLVLDDGKEFRIIAPNRNLENIYVQSIKLNGVPLQRGYITHSEIMSGGILEFDMGSTPNKSMVSNPASRPRSEIKDESIIPVPYVINGQKTFSDRMDVSLACIDTTADIFYESVSHALPGYGNFRKYSRPIRLTRGRKIRFYASKDSLISPVSEALFYKLSSSRKVLSLSPYTNQYSAGGQNALIDQVRGARDFRTGAWQGFEGIDLLVEVDLGFNQTIHRLGLNCFQDQSSWIFMPVEVIYEISMNGSDWEEIARVANDVDKGLQGAFIKEFRTDVWRTARYIRVSAESVGTCPAWHPGAGNNAWLFADELVIE